ncbi:MAG: hypothetical protein IPG50_35340 [Myxococcales bacterium]|nr:hypothetical protein [Myxococcales bacterium]
MTTTMTATESENQRELLTGGIWKGAGIGAAVGAVGNVVLYGIANASGISMVGEFMRGQPPLPMPFAPVIISSFIPAIFAALVAMALNRFTARPARIFTVVAVVFGLVSMVGPASIAGAGVGLRVVLALMHLVSGLTITMGILRLGRR